MKLIGERMNRTKLKKKNVEKNYKEIIERTEFIFIIVKKEKIKTIKTKSQTKSNSKKRIEII